MKELEGKLGIGVIELFILSLFGIPTVVLHDLSILEEGSDTRNLHMDFKQINKSYTITTNNLPWTSSMKPIC